MQIIADNLSVTIGRRTIIANQTFVAEPGTSLAFVGESGCGKTTLLNCVGKLIAPSGGRLMIAGVDATNWGERKIRELWRRTAAFVLQDYGLIDDESLIFNVRMRRRSLLSSSPDERAVAALHDVGLDQRATDPVSELSGGERQRVSIARAIYKQASLILADEPTASLDERNRQLVHDLILGETRRGATVLIATHDHVLADACDTVVRLDASG